MRVSFVMLVVLAGCGGGSTSDAGVGMDAGSGTDAGGGGTDAGGGGTDAGGGGTDAGDVDAGTLCGDMTVGECTDTALSCLCCPAGGPAQNCLCSTRCSVDGDCTDPARPHCNAPTAGGGAPPGICTPVDFLCAWGAVCAAPDTPILTPDGERPIAALAPGDLVYTIHDGALVARPLIRVASTPVVDHGVVRVVLETGRTLTVSGPHPSADGRPLAALAPGDLLGETRVVELQTVPYEHALTHDILPDSSTGTYVAAGVLLGSTLTR